VRKPSFKGDVSAYVRGAYHAPAAMSVSSIVGDDAAAQGAGRYSAGSKRGDGASPPSAAVAGRYSAGSKRGDGASPPSAAVAGRYSAGSKRGDGASPPSAAVARASSDARTLATQLNGPAQPQLDKRAQYLRNEANVPLANQSLHMAVSQ